MSLFSLVFLCCSSYGSTCCCEDTSISIADFGLEDFSWKKCIYMLNTNKLVQIRICKYPSTEEENSGLFGNILYLLMPFKYLRQYLRYADKNYAKSQNDLTGKQLAKVDKV